MKTAFAYALKNLLDEVELARRAIAVFEAQSSKAFQRWQSGHMTEDEWYEADRHIHEEAKTCRAALGHANQLLADFVYAHRAEFETAITTNAGNPK